MLCFTYKKEDVQFAFENIKFIMLQDPQVKKSRSRYTIDLGKILMMEIGIWEQLT